MSKRISSQAGRREAQDSSVRSVIMNSDSYRISPRKRAEAVRAAARLDQRSTPHAATLDPILRALATFGGRVTGFELPARNNRNPSTFGGTAR